MNQDCNWTEMYLEVSSQKRPDLAENGWLFKADGVFGSSGHRSLIKQTEKNSRNCLNFKKEIFSLNEGGHVVHLY